MKKSVGLVIMFNIPQEDGNEVLMAVLQRRGRFNTEKMKPETYPGCCQVTCHGRVEDRDSGGKLSVFHTALIRESIEELGMEFTGMCTQDIQLIELTHKTSEEEVVTYGALVPAERLKLIRLGADSGGLDPITFEVLDSLAEITPDMKKGGPAFTYTRALFRDEIEAIKKAFEVFGNK